MEFLIWWFILATVGAFLLGRFFGRSKHPLQDYEFQERADWKIMIDGNGKYIVKNNNQDDKYYWIASDAKPSDDLDVFMFRATFATEDDAVKATIEYEKAHTLTEIK